MIYHATEEYSNIISGLQSLYNMGLITMEEYKKCKVELEDTIEKAWMYEDLG